MPTSLLFYVTRLIDEAARGDNEPARTRPEAIPDFFVLQVNERLSKTN